MTLALQSLVPVSRSRLTRLVAALIMAPRLLSLPDFVVVSSVGSCWCISRLVADCDDCARLASASNVDRVLCSRRTDVVTVARNVWRLFKSSDSPALVLMRVRIFFCVSCIVYSFLYFFFVFVFFVFCYVIRCSCYGSCFTVNVSPR